MLDEKTLNLAMNVNTLKKELEHHIEEFDKKLHLLTCDIDNGIVACQCQYDDKEVKDAMSLERLAELQEFCRMWNILSNGIRGIL